MPCQNLLFTVGQNLSVPRYYYRTGEDGIADDGIGDEDGVTDLADFPGLEIADTSCDNTRVACHCG